MKNGTQPNNQWLITTRIIRYPVIAAILLSVLLLLVPACKAQTMYPDTPGKVAAGRGKYAFGFQEDVINGTRCFGHGGGAPGMNGVLQICPGPGYVLVVLANLDPPAASRVADFVTNRLPTK